MSVASGLAAVRTRIAEACLRCGRDPSGVDLIAVSKTRPATDVRAAVAAGQQAFGENRAQELADKARELQDLRLAWHMIGSVQTNKVRDLLAVPGLALVHSVDRRRLADALQAAWSDGSPLPVLLQVNASSELQKHGVHLPEAAVLAEHIAHRCPRLALCGVMAMGPQVGDPAPAFAAAARLRGELSQRLGVALSVLSLGMSGDLEAAIAAGSTMVRVGSAVFGAR